MKNKKCNKKVLGKGAIFSIIYMVSTLCICLIVHVFNSQVLDWKIIKNFSFTVDKVAVLSIITAIDICITTTLTLSLTIEGNKENLKFGLTPKTLNEYVGFPISLNSNYLVLVASFLVSFGFLKSNNGLLFYVFSFLSLVYFLISIIIGLPVLKGNNNGAFNQIRKTIDDVNIENMENDSTGQILRYLFSKGASVDDICFRISNKGKKKKSDNKSQNRKTLLLFLSYYLRSNKTNNEQAFRHWLIIKEHLYSLFKLEEPSPYCECASEYFNCLFYIYKREELRNEIGDNLYDFFIHYVDTIENDQNRAFVDYLFIRFVNYSLQNNDLTLFIRLKKKICEYEFGTPFNVGGRFNFSLVSFLFYCYCYDSKVPLENKNKIIALLTKKEEQSRYEDLSWNDIHNKIVSEKFDIDKKKFVDLISERKEWFEYIIFGKVFTPVITKELALEWYWLFLTISGKGKNLENFIDKEDEFETYLFKTFYDSIESGDIKRYKAIFDFYKNEESRGFYLRFDDSIKKEIDSFYLTNGIKKLDEEISKNSKSNNEIIECCTSAIKTEIEKYSISSAKNTRVKHYEITFFEMFDNSFGLELNAKCVSYNSSNYFRRYVIQKMNLIHLNNSDDYLNKLERLTFRKKNIFINEKFKQYCDYQVLPKECSNIVSKSVVFSNELFYYPVCFVTKMPFLGNINVEISIDAISDSEIEAAKGTYDSGSGYYTFKGNRYNETDFVQVYRKVFSKLRISVDFDFGTSPTGGLSINPFE